MTKYKPLILLLLFGSIWGMSEVVLGGIFDEINIAHSSVWLNAWAIFVLAVSRGVLNKPGSSTALGVIAATFKLANTTPFYCHLLGIFLIGVAFDLTATVLIKKNHKIDYRNCICGVVSAYGGYALFAVIITYLIRYDYWVSGGSSKVLHHIFVSGSYLALAAAAAVPLGFMAGLKGRTLNQYHSSWVFKGALLTSAIIWLLGRIAI